MKKIERKWQLTFILFTFMLFSSLLFASPSITAYAAAAAVEVEAIDYNELTLTLNRNENKIVYFSTDKTNWSELEAEDSSLAKWVMDISWVSNTKEVTLYFKGDIVTKVTEVTIPKMNSSIKAKFDKVDGLLTLSNTEDADYFQWRKNTDYTWYTVPLDENQIAYKQFVAELEFLRTKGAKIIVRTAPVNGTKDSVGQRPSKEITVSITKRGNAPSIKVNIKTLKLNTTVKQEYSLNNGITWKDCLSSMQLEDIVPSVLKKNGGKDAVVLFRTIATNSAPYSKTLTLNIPGQKAAPTAGVKKAATISYYTQDDKYLFMQFTDAAEDLQYEYVIIKPGKEFDPAKASWRTVKNNKLIKTSKNSAPEGAVVYFRYKGINENVSKGIKLQLPSEYASFNVSYGTTTNK